MWLLFFTLHASCLLLTVNCNHVILPAALKSTNELYSYFLTAERWRVVEGELLWTWFIINIIHKYTEDTNQKPTVAHRGSVGDLICRKKISAFGAMLNLRLKLQLSLLRIIFRNQVDYSVFCKWLSNAQVFHNGEWSLIPPLRAVLWWGRGYLLPGPLVAL